MRRFAISDIHGCCKTFRELVDNQLEIRLEDKLYVLGDYIDRGPDSKGVIDYILELRSEGYQVECLLGNHEEMLVNALEHSHLSDIWLRNGGKATLRSFNAVAPIDIPQKYWDFISELKYHIELDDYFLVHAGFNFSNEDIFEDRHAMLWIRRWYNEIEPSRLNGKTIVHGHTPISPLEIREHAENRPYIDIDAGCVYQPRYPYGYLCALNLDDRSLIFQPYIEDKED